MTPVIYQDLEVLHVIAANAENRSSEQIVVLLDKKANSYYFRMSKSLLFRLCPLHPGDIIDVVCHGIIDTTYNHNQLLAVTQITNHTKHTSTETEQNINAFDVLFGRASY